MDALDEVFDLNPDTLHARFTQNAPRLATEAAQRALADAGVAARDIDAVNISTCTGYLCPGLSSYVSQQLHLRPEILALDLVGQGCGAALPNLRAGEALLASGRCQFVLSICVEVCSAAFYLDDDPGVLISACLFGDSAGAAVLANAPDGRRRLQWKTSGSVLVPDDRDLLRFEHRAGLLRNILSLHVPEVAAKHAGRVLEQVLAQAEIPRSRLTTWILHPGGRDVLMALAQQLNLEERDLRWSASVLRQYGNLSSPSLYFVLQAALAGSAPDGWWWLSSFGAGFSCHGALVEVST
jgi:alkylresorcinol/alkylpyrone synthase